MKTEPKLIRMTDAVLEIRRGDDGLAKITITKRADKNRPTKPQPATFLADRDELTELAREFLVLGTDFDTVRWGEDPTPPRKVEVVPYDPDKFSAPILTKRGREMVEDLARKRPITEAADAILQGGATEASRQYLRRQGWIAFCEGVDLESCEGVFRKQGWTLASLFNDHGGGRRPESNEATWAFPGDRDEAGPFDRLHGMWPAVLEKHPNPEKGGD